MQYPSWRNIFTHCIVLDHLLGRTWALTGHRPRRILWRTHPTRDYHYPENEILSDVFTGQFDWLGYNITSSHIVATGRGTTGFDVIRRSLTMTSHNRIHTHFLPWSYTVRTHYIFVVKIISIVSWLWQWGSEYRIVCLFTATL